MSLMYPLAIINTSSVTSLVRIKLYHHSISVYHTNIETNKVVATLSENGGDAASENSITQLVNDIPGKRSVKNQLAIEGVES
jgi:hypothetical protein